MLEMDQVTTPDGVRLNVEASGEGPPIVLLHGWCGTTRVWDPVVPKLRDTRRVIRFDMRGCGGSDPEEGTHNFDHYAMDLKTVLDAADVQGATVVGWSLGVGVVHEFLRRFDPSRVGGVCLIDYPLKLDEGKEVADKVCHALNKRRDEFLNKFYARMFREDNEGWTALMVREAKRTTRRVACEMYKAMRGAAPPEEDTYEIPALLIFPEEGWFPEALADWRVRFPEHEVAPFPNSRHAAPLEETDRFVEALLDFTEPTGQSGLNA